MAFRTLPSSSEAPIFSPNFFSFSDLPSPTASFSKAPNLIVKELAWPEKTHYGGLDLHKTIQSGTKASHDSDPSVCF